MLVDRGPLPRQRRLAAWRGRAAAPGVRARDRRSAPGRARPDEKTPLRDVGDRPRLLAGGGLVRLGLDQQTVDAALFNLERKEPKSA